MNVCFKCIGDGYYREFVKKEGVSKTKCRYCKKSRTCIDMESLADEVDDVYRNSYEPSEIGDTPSDIICEMLGVEPDIADDLVGILSDREERGVNKGADALYDSDALYGEMDNDYFGNLAERRDEWQAFCHHIKHKRRFFNNELIRYLESIFSELKKFSYKNKVPLRHIDPSGPESTFYRARIAKDSNEEKTIRSNPGIELGPPPAHKARAGRMNPAGVSVFYGAFLVETCIAEIKCSVGELAIVGQFKLNKPLNVLDLTVLGTIEEPNYSHAIDIDEQFGLFYFLREFSHEISKPIREADSDLQYLPTQVLAEYFAYALKIDAVIYSSSQVSGENKNIVILNHAAKISDDDYLSFVHGSEDGKRVTAISYIYETECLADFTVPSPWL